MVYRHLCSICNILTPSYEAPISFSPPIGIPPQAARKTATGHFRTTEPSKWFARDFASRTSVRESIQVEDKETDENKISFTMVIHSLSLRAVILGITIIAIARPGFAIAPPIGITKNFATLDKDRQVFIHSYAGRIEFHDDTVVDFQHPPEYMSNEEFVRLVSNAYDEMIGIWRDMGGKEGDLPGAMIRIELGSDIWFASSMKSSYGLFWNVHGEQGDDSAGRHASKLFLEKCLPGTHSHKFGCGEPNVIENIYAYYGVDADLHLVGRRVAAWYRRGPSTAHSEKVIQPCGKGLGSYGCADLIKQWSLEAVETNTPPEAGDGSQWFGKYSIQGTPRDACLMPSKPKLG